MRTEHLYCITERIPYRARLFNTAKAAKKCVFLPQAAVPPREGGATLIRASPTKRGWEPQQKRVGARQSAILLVAGLSALKAAGVRVARTPEEIPGLVRGR